MIQRTLKAEVLTLSKEFPIVAILGPRQSGKTTLAKSTFQDYKYVSLEDPDVRDYAMKDSRGFLNRYSRNIILDEIQRLPQLFSYLQTHVDASEQTGQFIITGSHNYLLMEEISQSLAGRVGITTLLPLSLEEIMPFDTSLSIESLIWTGSYPRIYNKNIRPGAFYKSYLNTYIERDVRLIKNITHFDKFTMFLRILAGRTGQILNTLAISEDCGIAQNTIKDWLNILETSYIIFKLKPYHKNYNKRLIKNPKLYFYDTGLACYLLGILEKDQLSTHYYSGHLFETWIISELHKHNFNNNESVQFYYWRDNHRKEMDIIIEQGLSVTAVEIKSGQTMQSDYLKGLQYWRNLTNNPDIKLKLIYGGDNGMEINGIQIIDWKNYQEIF